MPTKVSRPTKAVSTRTKTSKSRKTQSSLIEFPSLVDGLQQAWSMIPKVALASMVVSFLYYFLMLIIIAVVGGGFVLSNISTFRPLMETQSAFDPVLLRPLLASGGVALTLTGISLAVLSMLYTAVQTLLFASAYREEKPDLGNAISTSWSLLIPLVAVSVLTSFLCLGGFMLFIIPGVIIAILVGFSSYAVVLDNYRGVDALKESARLISSSFWQLFLRALLVGILLTIISTILEYVFKDSGVVMLLFSILQTLFLTAYGVVLYEQSKQAAEGRPQPNVTWMFVVASIGVVMAVLSIGAVVRAIHRNPELQNRMERSWDSREMKKSIEAYDEQQDAQRKLEQLMQQDFDALEKERQSQSLYAQ